MTKLRIAPTLGGDASEAIQAHVGRLYAKPGARVMGVVELCHVERTQFAADEDKESSVKLAIKHLEVAVGEQDEHLRKALRAMFVQRTAAGTLDEEGEVELSKSTLEQTAGILSSVETARLCVALRHWADYADQASWASSLSASQYQNEIRTIARGLRAALSRAEDEDPGQLLRAGSGVRTGKK